jgi:ferredoxin
MGLFDSFKKTDNVLSNFGRLVDVDSYKCVCIRSRKMLCSDCVSACPASAVTVDNKKVEIDSSKCTECGVCAKICKLGVFSLKYFNDATLFNLISTNARRDGYVIFSCKKIKKRHKDAIVIPCVGWLDISVFLWCFAHFSTTITINHADCSACSVGCSLDMINEEVNCFNKFISSGDNNCTITFVEGDGADLGVKDVRKEEPKPELLTRRELFGYFKRQSRQTLGEIYKNLSTKELPVYNFHAEIVNQAKSLPIRKKVVNYALSECSEKVVKDVELPERYVLDVVVQKDKCNLCGICYKFCPTGALKELSMENKEGYMQKVGIEVVKGYCVGCDICIAMCSEGAINYYSPTSSSFQR